MTDEIPTPVSVPEAPTQSYQVTPEAKGSSMRLVGIIAVFLVITAAGVGTGYGMSRLAGSSAALSGNTTGAPGTISEEQVSAGKIYGTEDSKKFPDVSEGIIEKGGLDGEGTHHLTRPGGKTQTVYLTSSVVDLDLFAGDKVQVKGQTFSAQKAAWFMDVGSVKVIELDVQAPTETAAPAE